MPQDDTQDLLKQIVEFKRQNTNLRAFVDQIRGHFLLWNCNKCGAMKRFTKEVPIAKVMCDLCEIEMRPYAIQQYRQLRDQYDELDDKHSAAIAERNKYAKIVQELIPLLQEYGYNPEDNNPLNFIKSQFLYLVKLEEKIAKLE